MGRHLLPGVSDARHGREAPRERHAETRGFAPGGREALVKDGVAGAARFKDGLGRHGDFAKIR